MDEVKVLHIDQFEEQGGTLNFYCNDFKSHLNDHFHSISHAHKHDFFLTVVFTAGSGTHEIDFAKFPIRPGSVFMISPGQVHSWTFTDDIDGFIFFHSQEFFDKHYAARSIYQFPFFYSTQNSPSLQLGSKEVEKLIGYFDELLKESKNQNALAYQKLVTLVDLIYLDLSSWYLQEPTHAAIGAGGYSAKLRELGRFIDENFVENKSAAFYADKMNITTKHLNRIVKTTLDQTTSSLILNRVILEAKRRIVHENGDLSQIAYSLGYEDYAYFSKLFKARTGFTPKGFRAKYRY
ncbi:AraC family transcriptional regulator [Owenweeksia hongkongensis]|uniref:AraC family transcriptional regulator n=1 Tax=Owenweeksia hongkongensis TaxID=253245 RepID=UPI003A909876